MIAFSAGSYDNWKTDYPEVYDAEEAPELPENATHEELIAAGFEEVRSHPFDLWVAGFITTEEMEIAVINSPDFQATYTGLFDIPLPAQLPRAA